MSSLAHTPRSFRLLVAIVAGAGIILFAYSWREIPPMWSAQLGLVIIVAALSEFFSFKLPNFTVVLAYPLAMAAVVLGGPAASGLVAGVSAITVSDIRMRKPASVLIFNLTSLVLVSCAAGWTYVLLGGHVLAAAPRELDRLSTADFPSSLVAIAGCAIVSATANLFFVSLGISLYQGLSFHKVVVTGIPFVTTQLALPFVGLLMAQVMAINASTLPLFVFPLAVAQKFYQRSTSLRCAYADTVRSLVGALEAKDPYTAGHSERVANYALALGSALGLDDATLERIEYAALLHDLGKLEVPSGTLTKQGALTGLEWELVRRHPERGAAMVMRIPPLHDLADYVGRHHEWYGGGGYPDSMAAPDIPQVALILAVADSYDAMTTTRAYRPALDWEDAVSQLVGGAGTQFDPVLVGLFIEQRIGRSESSHAVDTLRDEPNLALARAVQL